MDFEELLLWEDDLILFKISNETVSFISLTWDYRNPLVSGTKKYIIKTISDSIAQDLCSRFESRKLNIAINWLAD